MTNKTFHNIPSNECLEVYYEIMDNANSKWRSAVLLVESKDYGSAVSLAVISTEETIKALVIFIDSLGFNFRRIKGMDIIFNHHRLRYALAYIIFAVSLFGDDLKKLALDIRDNPTKVKIYMDEISDDINLFLKRRLRKYAIRKLIQFRRELKWFSKMDVFRQDGFYCDYQDYLKNPIRITKENCNELMVRLTKVRETVNSFCLTLQLEDINKQLDNLRIDFIKKGYYNDIAVSIKNMKINRSDPFGTLSKLIE